MVLAGPAAVYSKVDKIKNKIIKKYRRCRKPGLLQTRTTFRIGRVFVMGEGGAGQLGLPSNRLRANKALLIDRLPKFMVDIAAGGMHSACLSIGGNVYTWGCNDEGALGRDDNGCENVPGSVGLPGRAIQITAGDSHTAVLTMDGEVYAWGVFRDQNGKIGLKQLKRVEKYPQRIDVGCKVKKIASGADHLLMLDVHERLWSVGCGEVGQLGNRPREEWLEVKLLVDIPCSNAWAGTYSSFIQTEDQLLAIGLNNHCQLGMPTDEQRLIVEDPRPVLVLEGSSVIDVAPADHHTLFLTDTGFVYSSGRKEYGRLGTGDKNDNRLPTLVRSQLSERLISGISTGPSVSLAVSSTGTLFSWGMADSSCTGHSDDVCRPMKVASMSEYRTIKVSTGGQHTLILAKRRYFT